MSKMDNLRAMREARYEQAQARAATSTATPGPRPGSQPEPQSEPQSKPATTARSTPAAPEPAAALCGHRAISGRTCTREAGHAAKSHRYA